MSERFKVVLVTHRSVQVTDDHWHWVTDVYEAREDESVHDLVRRYGQTAPGDVGTLVIVSEPTS